MHPLFASARRLTLYLLLFAVAGWLMAELLVGTSGWSRIVAAALILPLVALHAFSCLASWYLCRALPLGEGGVERVLVAQLGAGLLASGVVVGLGLLWAEAAGSLVELQEAPVRFREGASLVFVFALLLYLLVVAVHYLLIAVERSREAEGRAYEMRLQAREAELRALQAQLDPHFLFNSLHSIHALVAAAPGEARTMCLRLAEFLRSTLRYGGLESIPLAAEVALADSYLEVERLRFGDRLRVRRSIPAACRACRVPPLLLQPLVENALRHGIAGRVEGGLVSLTVERRHARLRIVVENPLDPDRPPRQGEGIGLANVRRRLAAIYGDEATVRVRTNDGRFRVELSLPAAGCDAAPARRQPEKDDEPAMPAHRGGG